MRLACNRNREDKKGMKRGQLKEQKDAIELMLWVALAIELMLWEGNEMLWVALAIESMESEMGNGLSICEPEINSQIWTKKIPLP